MQDRMIAFRLPEQDRAKLARLAKATDRTVSAVLRQLIKQATLSGGADLHLDPQQVEGPTAPPQEARA
jgi:predicted DNA-binding protein